MSKLGKTLHQMLLDGDGHMTAEEMFLHCKERNMKISMASVYRVLNRLVDEGYVRKISIQGLPDVFDKTTANHGHLICSCCNSIKDVYLEDLGIVLEEINGVPIDSYDLNMRYICEDCKKKKKKEKKKWLTNTQEQKQRKT